MSSGEGPSWRTAEHNLRNIFASCKTQHFASEIVSRDALDLGAKPLRQPQRLINISHDLGGSLLLAGALDIKRDPCRVEACRQSCAGANHGLGFRIAANANQ